MLADIRHALRSLRRTAGFTVSVVLSLAIGVGGTTTMFSIVDAVDFRPLPFPNAERLLTVHEVAPAGSRYCRPTRGCAFTQTSLLTASDWQEQFRTLDAVAMMRLFAELRWRHGDESEPIKLVEVSGNLFSLFGVRPFLGRGFLPSELEPGADPVIVLSYGLWRSRFGGDPRVIGTHVSIIDLNRRIDRDVTIVGVMPKAFRALAEEAWSPVVPLHISGVEPRRIPEVLVIGRLAEGRTIGEARAEARTIAARLAATYPETNAGWSAEVRPLEGSALFGFWSFGDLWNPGRGRHLLLGVVAVVLLVATLNVATLFLVRGLARQQELTVRRALGASRVRLARRLVIECLCATAMGGALGVLLATWSVPVVRAALSLDAFAFRIGIDARALGFALLVSLVTGLTVSALPVLRLFGLDGTATLREHALRSAGSRSWARRVLVGVQIACALMLLAGAGLLTKELRRLRYDEPGYDPGGLYQLQIPLPSDVTRDAARQQAIALQALDGVRRVPGVVDASLGALSRVELPGRPEALTSNAHLAIGPEFFQTARIPILRGRAFGSRDVQGAPPVAILDQTAAQRLWPGEDPVGKSLLLRHGRDPEILVTVVGVAARSKLFWLSGPLTGTAEPLVYRPIEQNWSQPRGAVRVYARLRADAGPALPALRAVLYQATRKPVDQTEITALEEEIATELRQQRFDTMVLTAFALFAILLAAMGVHGVVAYTVTQRTGEIGIRMALGADQRSVLMLVTREALVLALASGVAGVAGSLAVTRVLRSFLVGTSPADPMVLLLSATMLAMVVVVATLIPARRAAAVDPVASLRAE